MNKYFKRFFYRGAIFGGFGPIIFGIVCICIETCGTQLNMNGGRLLSGIISCYILAFFQAGASVFNQIEHWQITKCVFFHFLTIYLSYVFCYLVNSWLPFSWRVILIFTLCFILVYAVIWLTVWLSVKVVSKRLNKKLNK